MATTNIQKFAGNVEVSGALTGDGSGLTTLNGSQVTTGTVAAARIANLDGSKITTGTLGAARIPSLDAGKITSGTLGTDRIPSLDAGKITSGTLGTNRIPDLDAGKITSGTITTAVDTASAVKGGSLYTDQYIYHDGDTDTYIDFPAANEWRVVTNGGERMRINTNGNVGIGTASPGRRLDVRGYAGGGGYGWRIYVSSYDGYGDNGQKWFVRNQRAWNQMSIYGERNVMAGQYFVSASDRRIKKEIVDIDDGEALQKFRQLQPKKYKYIDVTKGNDTVFGFIAQEVANVIPLATTLDTNFIPNIYDFATVSDSNIITFQRFNTSNLESNATTIKIIDLTDEGGSYANIVDIINEQTIRVDRDVSGLAILSNDNEDEEPEYGGSNIFVYGQEVSDFHTLSKDAVWTVCAAALQEVDRKQQADQIRITTLEEQVSNLFARVTTIENA